MTEAEQETTHLEISQVLGNILQLMKIPVDMAPHAMCMQVVPYEDEDGKKSVTSVLALTKGNDLNLYWYGADELGKFINNAIACHQAMLAQQQALNPLIVANPSQMQQATAMKDKLDREVIKWPKS